MKMNKAEPIVEPGISDHEIISRVLGGEKELYAVIVRRYNQRLYRIGMSVINDDMEVEDIMQVAYIKAYENLRKFSFRSTFSTWLTRILINESLLRRKRRKMSTMLDGIIMNNHLYGSIDIEYHTPAVKVMNSELKYILEKAISNLPEKYRTVFIMREIENMNVAETKECLAISEVNVKVRLNRAKAILRNSLATLYRKEDLYHFHLSRCNRITETVLSKI